MDNKMKSVSIIVGLILCLAVGLVFTQQQTASADSVSPAQLVAEARLAQMPISSPEAEALKKCNFNSDCPYGKCDKHLCGGCNFNSDCKGWGKCSNHRCGSCNFDSDCKGFGKCSSHRCTKPPY